MFIERDFPSRFKQVWKLPDYATIDWRPLASAIAGGGPPLRPWSRGCIRSATIQPCPWLSRPARHTIGWRPRRRRASAGSDRAVPTARGRAAGRHPPRTAATKARTAAKEKDGTPAALALHRPVAAPAALPRGGGGRAPGRRRRPSPAPSGCRCTISRRWRGGSPAPATSWRGRAAPAACAWPCRRRRCGSAPWWRNSKVSAASPKCARGPCPLAGRCLLKHALDAAERSFVRELDRFTLADVPRRADRGGPAGDDRAGGRRAAEPGS